MSEEAKKGEKTLAKSDSERKLLQSPKIVKPHENKIYRKSCGISIDNYNPNERKSFTDPLTIEALRNLGISADELFTPSEEDIAKYTKENELKEMVKSHLEKRIEEAQKLVKEERDRLASLPTDNEQNSGEQKSERNSIDLEKKYVARLILDIMIDKEKQMRDRLMFEQQKKEQEQIEMEERERMKKVKNEKFNSNEKLSELHEKRLAQLEKRRSVSQEKDKLHEEKKQELKKLQKAKTLELEELSQRRKIRVQNQFVEKEKERSQRMNELSRTISDKQEKTQQARDGYLKEVINSKLQKDELMRQKLEVVRQQRQKTSEEKRKKLEEKEVKIDTMLDQCEKTKAEKLKVWCEKHNATIERNQGLRHDLENSFLAKSKERQASYDKRIQAQQERSSLQQSELRKRQLEKQLKLEDIYTRSKRIERLQIAQRSTNFVFFELKQKTLDDKRRRDMASRKENEKVRKVIDSKKSLVILERDRIVGSGKNPQGEKPLAELATQYGLDFASLKEEAQNSVWVDPTSERGGRQATAEQPAFATTPV